MSAQQGGANFVRYFFYAKNTITQERKQALVALAYATARAQQLAPKAILIRSDIHDTTTVYGKRQKDPNGWHGTFAYKDANNVIRSMHETAHGYTSGRDDNVLKEANSTPAKADSTPRGGADSGKVVWPEDEAELEE